MENFSQSTNSYYILNYALFCALKKTTRPSLAFTSSVTGSTQTQPLCQNCVQMKEPVQLFYIYRLTQLIPVNTRRALVRICTRAKGLAGFNDTIAHAQCKGFTKLHGKYSAFNLLLAWKYNKTWVTSEMWVRITS